MTNTKDIMAGMDASSAARMVLHSRNGESMDMRNHFLNQTAVLICGGPSLNDIDLVGLRASGIPTMAVNNAWATYRPDMWVCVDKASSFLDSGWGDPRIMKFCPAGELRSRLRRKEEDGQFSTLSKTPGKSPNTFFYRRTIGFNKHTFLDQPVPTVGNAGDQLDLCGVRGGRSVMLAGIRILHYLGFRKILITGADFNMNIDEENYSTGERHSEGGVKGNNKTYESLNTRLISLIPHFEERGLEILNCTPGGDLRAFPRDSLVKQLEKHSIDGPQGKDAIGWYQGHDAQRHTELDHFINRDGSPYSKWHQKIYAAAASMIGGNQSVADLGCGTCFGLHTLRRSGHEGDWHGYDMNPCNLYDDDYDEFGHTTVTGDFMAEDIEQHDIVMCIEVISHMTNDLDQIASKIYDMTGSMAIISTPDIKTWKHGRFTLDECKSSFEAIGFVVMPIRIGPSVMFICKKG